MPKTRTHLVAELISVRGTDLTHCVLITAVPDSSTGGLVHFYHCSQAAQQERLAISSEL